MSLLSISSIANANLTVDDQTNRQEDQLQKNNITVADIHNKIDDLFRSKSILTDTMDPIAGVRDSSWVSHSMMADGIQYSERDDYIRFWSVADLRFEDTSLGGNYVINPRPQYTRYADARAPGLNEDKEITVATTGLGLGMGMYYAEAIETTHQTIHMSFGIPEFNSLTSFTKSFFNNDMNRLATRGRIMPGLSDVLYYVTKAIVGWPFKGLHAIEYTLNKGVEAFKFLAGIPNSKYYYMRPMMAMYWSAVTNIVNTITSYRGWSDFIPAGGSNPLTQDLNDSSQEGTYLSRLMPDIFDNSGFIDIYKVANRSTRLRFYLEDAIAQDLENGGYRGNIKELKKTLRGRLQEYRPNSDLGTLQKLWNYHKVGPLGRTDGMMSENDAISAERAVSSKDDNNRNVNDLDSIAQHFNAIWKDGGRFATFRVDHTGSVSESFQSSTGETDLASKFNGMSAQGRAAKYGAFGGNIDGGLISGLLSGVEAIATGAVAGVPFIGEALLNVFKGATGSAYVEIPEYWQNSSASMPRMSYTMQLVSPYGNPVSQLINIYIPLAMVLAGAVPLSTGQNSYTSPFLCQVFDKGRCQTRLGIIDSLQISRGTSNLGYNRDKNFMAVDVTFTVKDLSTVMHMPVSSGFSLDPLKAVFSEDTIFTDYMSVLASNSLGKNIYASQRLKKRLKAQYIRMHQITSAGFWSMYLHDATPLGILDMFFREADRV